MRWFIVCVVVGLCIAIGASPLRAQEAGKLIVFAASSLTEALTDVGNAYAKTGKPKPVFSFAASSALARQIENGAPAGLFVSADEEWMDYLDQRKLIVPTSRTSFLGNTLVLITPADRPLNIAITMGFELKRTLGTSKLAIADPTGVPAGRYAKAALESLGIWQSVQDNVVRGDNVRSAMVVGEARAAVMVAASISGLPVFEFPPASVKESVTGWGGAPKQQVAQMVLIALGLTEVDGPTDVTDAIAIALARIADARMEIAMARR